MNTDSHMQRALDLAAENVKSSKGGPFGAVIVKDNKIIAEGVNLVTHNCDPTAHAEILAIREACAKLNNFRLNDCELFTTCEPCPMCLAAIYWARIKKVFYAGTHKDAQKAGFDDSFIYQELEKNMTDREIGMEQLMQQEAKKVFESWIQSETKIKY